VLWNCWQRSLLLVDFNASNQLADQKTLMSLLQDITQGTTQSVAIVFAQELEKLEN